MNVIIGLPSNIFFGTGMPTVVGSNKDRNNNNVIIIDASKEF